MEFQTTNPDQAISSVRFLPIDLGRRHTAAAILHQAPFVGGP
jgi:hypothetical protein